MQPARTVVALGIAQTLAWASSYYLPAMLAGAMARDLGVGVPLVFGAFSLALIVAAFVGPWAGRTIDRRGGRSVLIATNLLFALALVCVGCARSTPTFVAGWAVMGLAMGSGLYEAAFATLVRIYGSASRGAITGVTLIAGFASTIGWPLSAWLELHYGWRNACFTWAALHLAVALPLNASLPRADAVRPTNCDEAPTPSPAASHAATARLSAGVIMGLLALVFAATWFISTAMAAHLPRALQAAGASLAAAVGVGALVGPAQVAGRLLEFGLLRRAHPLLSARLAALAHPLGAILLFAGGAAMAPGFALLHGLGNGILTIAMGTLPLALLGVHGYGARQGWIMLPARIAQAAAPFLFGLALDQLGESVFWLSATLALVTFAALMVLR